MLHNNNQQQSAIRAFYWPQDNASTVFDSSSNIFTVIGAGDHNGAYPRNGNIISGPDGIHAIIGSEPIGTIDDLCGEYARDYRDQFWQHRAVTPISYCNWYCQYSCTLCISAPCASA